MNTLNTCTTPEERNSWRAFSNEPLIEISLPIEEHPQATKKLSKTTNKPTGSTTKKYAHRFKEEVKTTFCNAVNIPGKLFQKNEKLLSFTVNINCS